MNFSSAGEDRALLPIAELERAEHLVGILEVVFTIFKYMPYIIGSLAAVSLFLFFLNFVEKSYGWATFNLVLGLAGFWFVSKISRRDPEHFEEPSKAAH